MSVRESMRRPRAFVVVAVLLVLAGAAVYALLLPSTKHGTAYFASVKGIYPHDRVRIKGVDVGTIESITPEPGRVRVEFTYDAKYELPAGVKAAIVTPTLVSTRFIQLAPVYRGGPAFPDGGVIPSDRTAVPLEFDDLKKQLVTLADEVGPTGLDRNGALSNFLNVAGKNAQGGNGQRLNDLIHQAAGALEAVDNGGDNLFASVSNLQVFVGSLGQIDQQMEEFNSRLASVSSVLADNRGELSAALDATSAAARDVDAFIASNGGPLNKSVADLGQLTSTIAQQRDNLATLLHVGPNTLTNLYNIISPRSLAFTGAPVVDNLSTPADFVCSAYAEATASKPNDAVKWCGTYLGPLLHSLRMYQPPVGANAIVGPENGVATPEPGSLGAGPRNPPAQSQLPPPALVPGQGGLRNPPAEGGN